MSSSLALYHVSLRVTSLFACYILLKYSTLKSIVNFTRKCLEKLFAASNEKNVKIIFIAFSLRIYTFKHY